MTSQDWNNIWFALLITLPIALMILGINAWWHGHRRKGEPFIPKLVPPPPFIERAKEKANLHVVRDKTVNLSALENMTCPCGEVCELRTPPGLLHEYENLLLVVWAVQHNRPILAKDMLRSLEKHGSV